VLHRQAHATERAQVQEAHRPTEVRQLTASQHTAEVLQVTTATLLPADQVTVREAAEVTAEVLPAADTVAEAQAEAADHPAAEDRVQSERLDYEKDSNYNIGSIRSSLRIRPDSIRCPYVQREQL
jgi:hypothetical protein